MGNTNLYTFQKDLKTRLKSLKFKKEWDESEAEYLLARQVIEARLSRKLSQRGLAKKLRTSQAAISRLETMRANPSLALLKRVAHALETKFVLSIK